MRTSFTGLAGIVICFSLSGCLYLQGFENHDRFRIKPPILAYALDGRLDKVREYVEAKGDVNVTDVNGNTPLMMAVVEDHYDVAKYLLTHGANPSLKNKIGETALDIAKRGVPKRVTGLLEGIVK